MCGGAGVNYPVALQLHVLQGSDEAGCIQVLVEVLEPLEEVWSGAKAVLACGAGPSMPELRPAWPPGPPGTPEPP